MKDERSRDENFIRRCIELSKNSVKNGGAPFGALIVQNGKIIADSVNNAQNKVSDHAEILVLDKAHKILGTSNLSSCALYSNCEPCPMCSFMIREYKIKKVVFAVPSLFMGGFSKWKILQDKELSEFEKFFGKVPEVISGLLEDEAKKVFDEFPPFVGLFGSDVRENSDKI
jgi:tRNA(adenine34) deaminase